MPAANIEQISLPDGSHLEAVVCYPDVKGSAPGLIVAPGSGYPKEGSLIVELCEQAVQAGFVTVRFDWRYTAVGGKPSSNHKREVEDLITVLTWVESLPAIDRSRLVLTGKSLGAGIAWRLFHDRPDMLAALLLTPVFRDAASGPRNYPDLLDERRPVYLLTGSSDPLNNLSVMQDYLQGAGSHLHLSVVAGNHGLELSRRRSSEALSANLSNIRTAVMPVVDWLREIVAQ